MSTDLVDRARAGDGRAFGELIGPYRRELQVHCYQILGSALDAEDALQETLVAAWQGLAGFEGRSSVRVWLYQIATRRCLNALRAASRRPQMDWPPPGVELPEPTRLGEVVWLEPYPDVLLEGLADVAPGPEARYEATEAISVAFVTALQLLPPRQRAVLILRDVLGFRASEAAGILDCTEESVTSALKRARAARTQGAGAGPASAPGKCRRRSALAEVEDDLLGLDLSVFDQVEPGARRLHPVSERAQQQAGEPADPLSGGQRLQLGHGLQEGARPHLIGRCHPADELGHRHADERARSAWE